MIKLSKGLAIPISGKPDQFISQGNSVTQNALLFSDYPHLKATMLVQEGERVAIGHPLFKDKNDAAILYTSPASGTVTAINRGERRTLISLVIARDGNDSIGFNLYSEDEIAKLSSDKIRKQMLESGMWTAFRTRPFSTVPPSQSSPSSLFVTAMDTNPLAPEPSAIISANKDFFLSGLKVLRRLVYCNIYLCKAKDSNIPALDTINTVEFAGVHPAGLVGTHIHFLSPVNIEKVAWHIGYQDVIAMGALFKTGHIMTERVISLAGPQTKKPRLITTTIGAELSELLRNELYDGDNRIISGSVLSGRIGAENRNFLGRYHNQVSVIAEEKERKFMEWLMPGFDKFSIKPVFASRLFAKANYPLGSSTHGSQRAMVPIGAFEKVMPLDIEITWLLRSLLAGDVEMASKLGCLELDEEDLSLCSFVCSGKNDYGAFLRKALNRIREEGV